MPGQLNNENVNKPPQLPKKKMPNMRASLMIGAAIFVSMPIFIFSILPITAPIMVGVGAGVYTEQKTGSKTLAVVASGAAGVFSGFVEAMSGVGPAVVGAIGNLVADALTFLGWVIFYLWLTIIGVPFIGKSGASNRRLIIFMTSFVIGLVPLLNIMPALLIGVTLIVIGVQTEDAKKLAKYKEQLQKYNALKRASSVNKAPKRTYGGRGFAEAM